MSRKYSNSKKTAKQVRKGPWILLGILFMLLIGLLILVSYLELQGVAPDTEPTQNPSDQQIQADTVETEHTDVTETQEISGLHLGSDVYVTGYHSYTGAFMEDRTDEIVSDVLAIQVTNNGDSFIQLMDITLIAGDIQAEFTLSTLFPGQTVVVLEKNRMPYSAAPEFTTAETSSVSLFEADPGMAEDKIEIQCLDGVINITNISGEDITNDILVYYKNFVGGIYYGGITYRLRVEGGLKAGEIRQGSAAHFNTTNSAVVFATCG